jgi:hypothetical protein
MAIAKRLRRQAATCAALAKQTHDEEGRQRYWRLEQMYLELAESEERAGSPMNAVAGESQIKPAA